MPLVGTLGRVRGEAGWEEPCKRFWGIAWWLPSGSRELVEERVWELGGAVERYLD